MDKTQLYWLFLKFIGGEYIDIEGLYLKPERILRDGNTIEFLIHNPNDISFYIGVVGEELDEILLDFSKFTNHKFKYHIDTNYPDIYFNKTLENDIQSYLNSKTTLKLRSGWGEIVEIKGKSVGFYTEHDYDRIIIWNNFTPKSAFVFDTRTDEITEDDINICVDKYIQIIESTSSYFESDEVYQEIDEILHDYPLISTDWIAQVYHTGFMNLP
jgi:hypothetical protein